MEDLAELILIYNFVYLEFVGRYISEKSWFWMNRKWDWYLFLATELGNEYEVSLFKNPNNYHDKFKMN